jgi:hypothetical protein
LAERGGFEPPEQFPVHRFSKPAPSASRPPLRTKKMTQRASALSAPRGRIVSFPAPVCGMKMPRGNGAGFATRAPVIEGLDRGPRASYAGIKYNCPMASDREIDKLFALFLCLPLAGVLQFVVANTAGLGASLALGALVLAVWVATLSLMVLRGSFFSGFPRLAVGIFGLFAAWTGWISSLPPYFRDDLIIHLEVPKYVLRAGAWTSIPFQPSSVFPNSLLPLNAVLVNAGLDWAVSFIPALFYLACALLLARWVAAEFGAGWGLFAGAGFLLEPAFFRLSTTAYNDPVVAFFSCAGAYYFWVFR